MTDPFKINGPTCISFSGGRTSAYMLWRVLQSNGGLPDEAIVCFANTGKELEETLEFVRDCEWNWGVSITWLEYRDNEKKYAVVNFDTASRNGEPFEKLIRNRNRLPNPVARWCTGDLKVKPIHRFLKSIGWLEFDEWDHFLGIRADEQRRAVKLRGTVNPEQKRETRWTPLVDAGITKGDVGDFWRGQSFDLKLPNNNGVTMHGNCDLCYLKNGAQIASLIAERPERAVWWAAMEDVVQASGTVQGGGGVFRMDRPSYSSMLQYSKDQTNLFDPNEEAISCFCGD